MSGRVANGLGGLSGGPRPTIREAIAHAARVEPLAPDAETRMRAGLTELDRQHMPWYLRLLIGGGAWMAVAFLLPFLAGIVYLIAGENQEILILLGLMLAVGASVLRHKAKGPFLRQLTLVCAFCGQLLAIGAGGMSMQHVPSTCLLAIAVSGGLLFGFPDRIQRFCSTLIIAGAAATLVHQTHMPGAMDAFALVLVFAMLALWRIAPRAVTDEASELVEPVVYALAVAMFGLLITDAALSVIGVNDFLTLRLGLSARIGFIVALLWLASAIFGEMGVPLARPEVACTFAGIVLFGYITRQTPAIIVAMLIGLLGFDRRASNLVALAAAFFLAFGAFYYYSLQITLLQKSLLLAASGALCLAGWAAVRWRFGPEAQASTATVSEPAS